MKLITVEFTVHRYVNTEDRFYDASLFNMQYIERESSGRRSITVDFIFFPISVNSIQFITFVLLFNIH